MAASFWYRGDYVSTFYSKTDWTASDFYNVADWERLSSNIETVVSRLSNLGISVKGIYSLELPRGVYSLPYVSLINKLEKNLQKIYLTLGVPGVFKTWYAVNDVRYGGNPSFEDWNRWEKLILEAYNTVTSMSRVEYISNEFYSGEV